MNFLYLKPQPQPLDKLELIIREKQAELQGLQAELNEALTGIESPDYETAGRIQPLLYGVRAEIERLEKLRRVPNTSEDFPSHLSRFLTDDAVTTLELWTQIKDHWNDSTFRLLEIRKGKSRGITCTLRLTDPANQHLHGDYTTAELQRIGWKAGRGGKTFWFKTRIKSPDQLDAFCQMMSVAMLEALAGLWGHGQQQYQFK